MKALITALLAWIALELEVAPPAPPDVETVSQQELVEMVYGTDAPDDAAVTAVYESPTGTIYLDEEWRADDLRDRSTLVHELIHHVQQSRGTPAACLAARESAAYHLQIKWLRQKGVRDPYAFLDIDEFTIAVLSVCPQ